MTFYAAQAQGTPQPSQTELTEMSQRALTVVRLLDEYRRSILPESERSKVNDVAHTSPEDSRPPKRPWEEMSQEGVNGTEPAAFVEVCCTFITSWVKILTSFTQQYNTTSDKTQTTAEQDMELIRTKRATSTAGANGTGGQAKSKYRKRSVSIAKFSCFLSCEAEFFPRSGLVSGLHLLVNATLVIFEKLLSGGEVLMVRGRCVMPVDCVSSKQIFIMC